MALTQISTNGVKNDAITAGKIPANAVGSSEIVDDAVGTAQIADDGVVQAAIADEAVDEARLQISNAGTNGQFLSKQSSNTGGLTWADAGGGIATEYDAFWEPDGVDPVDYSWGIIGSGVVSGTYYGNLARVTSLSAVGNGMSESAGVFTFPSTGFWKIHVSLGTRRNETGTATVQLKMEKSTDSGSSWSTLNETFEWRNDYATNDYMNNDLYNFFNVTNATTTRLRFSLWNTNSMSIKLQKKQCLFEFTKVA
tara:strand:- start:89 stop:847 length:759 start_codon:yes stop_codon:yes gene_type:complete